MEITNTATTTTIINDVEYFVNNDEFTKVIDEEFCNLNILSNVGTCERIVSLLHELSLIQFKEKYSSIDFVLCGQTHGGFIPINLCKTIQQESSLLIPFNIFLLNTANKHKTNIERNQNNILPEKPFSFTYSKEEASKKMTIFFAEKEEDIYSDVLTNCPDSQLILLTTKLISIDHFKYILYPIKNTQLILYIPRILFDPFLTRFRYYIKNGILEYDNLIHLCVMVKNGGDLFKKMLIENLEAGIIDRWTILDTGSTDDTVENIKSILVGKRPGNLYQEPFINFRESRNKCLDLAGKGCKFNVMLDDTYIVKSNLRDFLNRVRGDQNASSFSISIHSRDLKYLSNRITKSQLGLRYIYTMHEIIQSKNNVNVGIPEYCTTIEDVTDDFMKNRSVNRLEYDLKCLQDMIKETPDEPRHVYYLAQTYKNMNNYEKALEFYYARAHHKVDGFEQEKFDALFEYTRLKHINMNSSWEELEPLYKMCHEWQPTRPEGTYMLGVYYYNRGDKEKAYKYLKQTFEIGYPYHQQYSLKPTLSFKYTPYYLCDLCYIFNDFKLGLDATILFLQNNTQSDEFYQYVIDWYKIFEKLTMLKIENYTPTLYTQKTFCIVADGGFSTWSGKDILTNGVGGSETWVIEMARYIKKLSDFNVIVFCKCEENEIFEGVNYKKLEEYIPYISTYSVEHCVISRFSEYIPVSYHGFVENVHVILHDINLSGNIIPINPKLKTIFCLTEWHKDLFLNSFPMFNNITHSLHYGIDMKNFLDDEKKEKRKNSFIYSSFPNRGLSVVLKMWPRIQKMLPDASLDIFVNLENKWVNEYYGEEIQEIKKILEDFKELYPRVKNHGWVNKKTLADFWKTSHVWLYPCKFSETFCLTALEAALTKTLVVSNDLAALQNTVGDRGIVIKGCANTDEWQEKALEKIYYHFFEKEGKEEAHKLIEKNFEWAIKHSWENQCKFFLERFIIPFKKNTENENSNKLPPLYYINLKTRQDRNEHFLEQIKRVNYPFDKVQRFEAVDGTTGEVNDINKNELSLFEKVNYSYFKTASRIIANQLSHYRLFYNMVQQKHNMAIICQDDVVFCNDFCERLYKVVQNIPNDAEIIQLGVNKLSIRDVVIAWDFQEDEDMIEHYNNKPIQKKKKEFCLEYKNPNSTCYIVTLKGAMNYIKYVTENGFSYATDIDMINYVSLHDIYYETSIVLATTNPYLGSDIFPNLYNKNTKNENDLEITTNNEFLDFHGKYNWVVNYSMFHTNKTDNILLSKSVEPKNIKREFIDMLLLFYSKKSVICNILELGSFVGTSTVSIVQYIPFANIECLDFWDDYDVSYTRENGETPLSICQKNIDIYGFSKNIKLYNADISQKLLCKVNNITTTDRLYDYIIIYGDSENVTIPIDCFLAWQLLKTGGIMIINNYNGVVDMLLRKIKSGYKIIDVLYSICIQKI